MFFFWITHRIDTIPNNIFSFSSCSPWERWRPPWRGARPDGGGRCAWRCAWARRCSWSPESSKHGCRHQRKSRNLKLFNLLMKWLLIYIIRSWGLMLIIKCIIIKLFVQQNLRKLFPRILWIAKFYVCNYQY